MDRRSALAVDVLEVAVEEGVDITGCEGPWVAELTADVRSAGDILSITAALTASRASEPIVNGPCPAMSTARLREPRSVSTMPRPMESSPMRANGPTGISPPKSSAVIVSTHGIGSARVAQAHAYVEWVCTTPPTCGRCR